MLEEDASGLYTRCSRRRTTNLELETLEVEDAAGWRSWLAANHQSSQGVWLVFRKKGAKSLSYDDAIDGALAYGWIDSLVRKIDDAKYARKFTPRKPWSIWSSLNIARVKRLRAEGRMTRWGLEAFAKRTQEVSALERINAEGVEVPSDLEKALKLNAKAWSNYRKFAPSHIKRYVIWISAAKKPETRKRRITEAVNLISQDVKNLLK
jgi:uncharacterized protein YdeI (YjbR/CyaY-like superfamily)